jgi:arylsulfatase A-like enzyme
LPIEFREVLVLDELEGWNYTQLASALGIPRRQPHLFRNTEAIYPYVGTWGWNLTTAMAVDAIGWLKQLNAIAPDKPFFVYYVPGGTHAPHHPMPEWIKYISAA